MKKVFLLFYILLLALVSCSCTNSLPGKTDAGESSSAEFSQGQGGEEPTDPEAASIVFMGERITAPSSYPDVPELYTPVLDDLYLYGEFLHRYETLNREGKAHEVMLESDALQETIQQRGYISYPYGGIEGTSGYALVDLDEDDSPELLLLDDSPNLSGKQTPAIYSIFTIRNGQLVCLEPDSFALQCATFLSADGTFYRCVDWGSTGYTHLSAFRLEAGMSEFTITSEVHAELSFAKGAVPVPYWVKRENGEETNITEDEFDVLFEQYSNPKERMDLDFVPLHPGAVDPYSIPRSDEESPTTPVTYPQSYQGAPSEYSPILDDLYLFSERVRRGEPFDDAWGETGFVEYPDGVLGYAVVDVNGDGILELFLGTMEGLQKAAPHSMFTLKDGQPVLLQSFWNRSNGMMSADGTIYSVGSGGAGYTYLSSYRLDKNADALTTLVDMHSDYSSAAGKAYIVQVVDGKNQYITEKKFGDFGKTCENIPETMALTPISIAN